jgi:sugar/nucleoside kinase (ribokinase family)
MGPSVVIAKRGEYGAVAISKDTYFSLPAFPLETVVDPTGAGDTFAGGFVGATATGADVRTAVAYGTAVASFNVEEFGTERVARLTRDEVDTRVAELHALTTFDLLLTS